MTPRQNFRSAYGSFREIMHGVPGAIDGVPSHLAQACSDACAGRFGDVSRLGGQFYERSLGRARRAAIRACLRTIRARREARAAGLRVCPYYEPVRIPG